jgi:nucleoside-diphosphate-sugar epimerase
MGGGKQWRPLVHVTDVSQAFIKVLKSETQKVTSQIFNIGLDNFQIKNIAYLVREKLPFPVEIDIAPDDADKRNYSVNFQKAKEIIGYVAKVNIEQGVDEIYNALKNGNVDVGPKTVTVQWYKNILEAKKLIDSIIIDGKVL